MAWESLGVISVGEDWRSFPVLVTNSSSLRLIHTVPNVAAVRVGYLAQYFAFPSPGGRSNQWRRIYSGADPVILALPIPEELQSLTTTYALQIKAAGYYSLTPWAVEAQVYYR